MGGGGDRNRSEDLFLADVKAQTTGTFALTAANASADLDLYLLNEAKTTVIAQSNGPGGSETLTGVTLNPGKYFLAVSYADDGAVLTTDYTLQVAQWANW